MSNILSLITRTDAYKLCHFLAMPKKVAGAYSYIESRCSGTVIVPFGMQIFVKKMLSQPITAANVASAKRFITRMGGEFNEAGWMRIVKEYDGFIPVTIRAAEEGTPVMSSLPIVTVEVTDPELAWIAQYIETALLRAIWYPTTLASLGRQVRKELEAMYVQSGADLNMLTWALNDFGARGASSTETAEIGGAAHELNFMGSDNLEGMITLASYYPTDLDAVEDEPVCAFVVPASEHFIECTWGLDEEGEKDYIRHMINTFGNKGIVSIVADGRDLFRAVDFMCSDEVVQLVKSKNAKLVVRPDSGDMYYNVIRILHKLEEAYGSTRNAQGYLTINNAGIIQGDGINYETAVKLINEVVNQGFVASQVVLGSGGGLLQSVTRDTLRFAQKCSAYKDDTTGEWVGIRKDPITDQSKRSKQGRVALCKNVTLNGPEAFTYYDMDVGLPENCVDAMVTVYQGRPIPEAFTTFETIRQRIK